MCYGSRGIADLSEFSHVATERFVLLFAQGCPRDLVAAYQTSVPDIAPVARYMTCTALYARSVPDIAYETARRPVPEGPYAS
eukprot:3515842-Rhodomonas_salina.1